jgi:toxin-antitoxin system PIN domain toxin
MVDTNVLLYAINSDSPQHDDALAALESLANGSQLWVLSWGIIYEFLRVATHPRVFPQPLTLAEAYGFVSGLLECEFCLVLTETPHHLRVLKESCADVHRVSGNMVHDLHHAVIMREHGVKDVMTYDADFRAFSWVRTETPGE